jgi:hypothetical protein
MRVHHLSNSGTVATHNIPKTLVCKIVLHLLLHHLPIIRQNERSHKTLKRRPATLPPNLPIPIFNCPIKLGYITHTRPRIKHLPPITSLCRRSEITISESLDTIVGNSLCFGVVIEKLVHFGVEVGEIAFDLDYVLILAVCDEEVGVWFDPVGFVDNGDGVAVEEVFTASGVRMAYITLVSADVSINDRCYLRCARHIGNCSVPTC